MAKKNEQTKANKELGKKAKKIKEKMMNKVEDQIEKEQKKDLDMDQKTPPIIEEEMAEKEVENTPISEINKIIKEKEVNHLPVCKKNKKIIGLESSFDDSSPRAQKNPIFLMAGGFGKRLTPLTDKIPKPLLKVGSKPILQIILERQQMIY